jgi:hypothetical protein
MEWLAFFIAPAVAAIQVGVGYALVKPACAAGGPLMLTMLSVAMFILAAAGAGLGWARRERFIGMVAAGLNLLVILIAIFSTIPHFILHPCE